MAIYFFLAAKEERFCQSLLCQIQKKLYDCAKCVKNTLEYMWNILEIRILATFCP